VTVQSLSICFIHLYVKSSATFLAACRNGSDECVQSHYKSIVLNFVHIILGPLTSLMGVLTSSRRVSTYYLEFATPIFIIYT
jgi:hypothetical protein